MLSTHSVTHKIKKNIYYSGLAQKGIEKEEGKEKTRGLSLSKSETEKTDLVVGLDSTISVKTILSLAIDG